MSEEEPPPRFDEIYAKVRQRRKPAAPSTEHPRVRWPFLLVIAALCVGGWLLARKLEEVSRLQDCVMQGRKNCDKIEDPNER